MLCYFIKFQCVLVLGIIDKQISSYMNPQQEHHIMQSSHNDLKEKRFIRQNGHKRCNSSTRSEKQISNFYIKTPSLKKMKGSALRLMNKEQIQKSIEKAVITYEKSASIYKFYQDTQKTQELVGKYSSVAKPNFFNDCPTSIEQTYNNESKNIECDPFEQPQQIKHNKQRRTNSVFNPSTQTNNISISLQSKLLQVTIKLHASQEQNKKLQSEIKTYKKKLQQYEENSHIIKQFYPICRNPLLKIKNSHFLILQKNNEKSLLNRISQLERQLEKSQASSLTKIEVLQQQLLIKDKQILLNKQKIQKLNIEIDIIKRKAVNDIDIQKKAMKNQYNDLKKRFTQVLKQYTDLMKKAGKDEITKKVKQARMKSVFFKLNDKLSEDYLEKLSISSGD